MGKSATAASLHDMAAYNDGGNDNGSQHTLVSFIRLQLFLRLYTRFSKRGVTPYDKYVCVGGGGGGGGCT